MQFVVHSKMSKCKNSCGGVYIASLSEIHRLDLDYIFDVTIILSLQFILLLEKQ